MDELQRFEAFMKQAEFWFANFDRRREFEWKITLGFWAAILAGMNILKSYVSVMWWASLGAGAILVVLHVIWLYGIWRANKKDKNQEFRFQREAARILLGEDQPWSQPKPFLLDWSVQFQLLTTLVLVAGAILFLMPAK